MSRPRRGVATLLSVTVIVLVGMLTLAVVTAVDGDMGASASSRRRLQGRATALGALEEFYARTVADPTYLSGFLADGHLAHPAVTGWASLVDGSVAACPDDDGPRRYTVDCYHLDVRAGRGDDAPAGGSAPTFVDVEVLARTGCGGSAARCTYTRLRQRYRQRQFFDFLYFTQYATLDPALYPADPAPGELGAAQAGALCAERFAARHNGDLAPRDPRCVPVAFQGEDPVDPARRDLVAGPVFTNDDWITTCGNPSFAAPVAVAGGGWFGRVWAPAGGGCSPEPPSFGSGDDGAVTVGEIPLPSSATAAAQFAAIAPPDWHLRGPATVTLRTDGADATTVVEVTDADGTRTLGLPPTGVLYVDGDVRVSGVLAGKLSVFATGTLRVVGDLVYAGGATPANTRDLLGLTAGGAVVIEQPPVPADPATPPADRELDAVLLSLGRAVYVEGWDSPRWPAATPTLHLFGAMTGRYQGVFGAYQQSSGRLVSGFRKDFTYDSRLRDGALQPPYLLEPVAARWDRLDVAELPPCRVARLGPDDRCPR